MELFELSGVGEVLCKLSSSPPTFKLEELELTSRCPYGILPVEFMKIGEIHIFLFYLLKWSNAKVLHMETKKTSLPEKLIGLQFNMED